MKGTGLHGRLKRSVRGIAGLAICALALGCRAENGEGLVIREPAVAGAFYPADSARLVSQIDRVLRSVAIPAIPEKIWGIISPHAGYHYCGAVAAHGYAAIRGRKTGTVIVVAPSHFEGFGSISVFSGDAYRTPLGNVQVDKALAKRIVSHCQAAVLSTRGHLSKTGRGEHSLEVQLPFLQRALRPGFKIVPIVMGTPASRLCKALAATLVHLGKSRGFLTVFSTDLSHYHPHKNAAKMDQLLIESVREMNYIELAKKLENGKIEACGSGPLLTLVSMANLLGASEIRPLAYATSGEVPPFDKSRVVGYLSAVATKRRGASKRKSGEMNIQHEEKLALLGLARQSIESGLSGAPGPACTLDSELLKEKCGAFVTLHKRGMLRGCIGYIQAYKPLCETVVEMAQSAAFRDPRFPPVQKNELPELDLEISVLSPLRKTTDINEIQVGVHGIVITNGRHRGLLLPQVATEQKWDRDTFLQQTCVKAGLGVDAWKDPGTTIEIFSATVFGEKESGH